MKKTLITIGSIGMIFAPVVTTISCSSTSSDQEIPEVEKEFINVSFEMVDETLVKDTHYMLNSTKLPFIMSSAFISNDVVSADAYTLLETIADNLVKETKKITDKKYNTVSPTIILGENPGANGENIVRLHLPEIILTDITGNKLTLSEISDSRLKGLFLEAIAERSVERSAVDSTMGKIKTKSYLAAQYDANIIIPNSVGEIKDYWILRDYIYENEYKQSPIDFGSLTWNPYNLDATFVATQTDKVKVTHSETGTVSEIDGTNIKFASNVTLPSDVIIDIYNYHRRSYHLEGRLSNISTSDVHMSNGGEYDFLINDHFIYQNIWLSLRSTNREKYIPSEYSEWYEIIKLGNGVADGISTEGIPTPAERRRNYASA